MRPFRVEAPQGALVPIEQLKLQARVETDSEDSLITAFEKSAVDYFDGYTGRLGRCVLRQKWALPLIGEPEAVFLPFPDCREFAVERLDDQGAWSIEAGVTISQDGDCVHLADLPDDQSGFHLTCWAGWETADDVPENLKQAVRMLVAHWYDNRSAVASGDQPHQVPMAVESMISPLLRVGI